MPPKRKFIRSSTIRWSRLEVALLAFLQRMTHRPWGDDVRAAIRLYARQLPGFDADGFADFVRKGELTKVHKGVEREEFIQEVNAFLGSFEREVTPGGIDRMSSFEGRDASFKSTPKDFDLD